MSFRIPSQSSERRLTTTALNRTNLRSKLQNWPRGWRTRPRKSSGYKLSSKSSSTTRTTTTTTAPTTTTTTATMTSNPNTKTLVEKQTGKSWVNVTWLKTHPSPKFSNHPNQTKPKLNFFPIFKLLQETLSFFNPCQSNGNFVSLLSLHKGKSSLVLSRLSFLIFHKNVETDNDCRNFDVSYKLSPQSKFVRQN